VLGVVRCSINLSLLYQFLSLPHKRSVCGHSESLINKAIQSPRSILLFGKDFVTVENRLAIPKRPWDEALNVSRKADN
jgi:hypothetical protein